MNVFFDVDETILAYDGSLRPLVRDVFRRLVEDGHRIYVWSGARTADNVRVGVVERYKLDPYVTECFHKPIVNPRQAWLTAGTGVLPEFCVDDRQETIDAFGGALISSYAFGGPDDGDLQRVYELIRRAALSYSSRP